MRLLSKIYSRYFFRPRKNPGFLPETPIETWTWRRLGKHCDFFPETKKEAIIESPNLMVSNAQQRKARQKKSDKQRQQKMAPPFS